MTNQEMVNVYNGLCEFQEKEEKSFRETGTNTAVSRIVTVSAKYVARTSPA